MGGHTVAKLGNFSSSMSCSHLTGITCPWGGAGVGLSWNFARFLCRLRSIAAHRDHFVRRLSVCVSVCLSDSRTFLIVTHSYVSQATHAFLGMLPLCWICCRQGYQCFTNICLAHLSEYVMHDSYRLRYLQNVKLRYILFSFVQHQYFA